MREHQVFISYAREDRPVAELLAKTLESNGASVWWDRKLIAGASFDEMIDEALTNAGCVIVLWSRVSVESDWVKNEAAEGLKRKALVPVLLEDVRIPLQFRHLHAVNLARWSGDASHVEYLGLLQAVRGRANARPGGGDSVGPAVAKVSPALAHGNDLPNQPNRRRIVLAAIGAALTAAAGGLLYRRRIRHESIPIEDFEQLANSCKQLSLKLGSCQEGTGGYKANPYQESEDAYATGQVLYALFVSAQSGAGDIDQERSARGAQAMCRLAAQFFPTVEAMPGTLGTGPGLAPEPRVVALAWAVAALARYLARVDDAQTRARLIALRRLLLENGLDSGSFQFRADSVNAKRPNAYATVVALMALLECQRTLGSDPTGDHAITAAAAWLTKTYPSPSTSGEVAIQAVDGLAGQAFWVIERARALRSASTRTPAEERVAALLLQDLLKQCRALGSPEKNCAAPDGKVPNGVSPTPLIMLWLPWSALASVLLVRNPPRAVTERDFETLVATARTLLARLAARYDMNVDNYRYEPAEVVLTMAAALPATTQA